MFSEEIIFINKIMGRKISCNPMPLPQPLLTCYTAFQYNIYICKRKSGLSKKAISKMLSLKEENQTCVPIHIENFPNTWELYLQFTTYQLVAIFYLLLYIIMTW